MFKLLILYKQYQVLEEIRAIFGKIRDYVIHIFIFVWGLRTEIWPSSWTADLAETKTAPSAIVNELCIELITKFCTYLGKFLIKDKENSFIS